MPSGSARMCPPKSTGRHISAAFRELRIVHDPRLRSGTSSWRRKDLGQLRAGALFTWGGGEIFFSAVAGACAPIAPLEMGSGSRWPFGVCLIV